VGGRGVYRVLVVKREEKTLGNPRCSLEGNVKMDLLEVDVVLWTGS
jgi:hypothetical protein